MTTTRPRPLKVAHIGAGGFSRRAHAPTLRRLHDQTPPRVLLSGIADIDSTRPERARILSRDFGYEAAYADVDGLIDAVQPDLIVCVVEPRHTASLVARLLPRGTPLLIEKPPGDTPAEAAMLARRALATDTLHYVAFNRRRSPAIELARQWLTRHGAPRHAGAEMLRQGRTEADFAIRTGVHVVDTLRYLAGDITSMRATGVTYGPAGREYRASLRFASACDGEIYIGTNATRTLERYRFECADGHTIEVTISAPYSDATFQAGFRVSRGGEIVVDALAPADPLVANGLVGEYQAFLEGVERRRQPDCSLIDGWRSMVVAAAIEVGHDGIIARELVEVAGEDKAPGSSRRR